MTQVADNRKQSFKDVALFLFFYFFTFLLLIRTFSDGAQTTGMFFIIDIIVSVLIAVYFLLAESICRRTGWPVNFWTKAILLFVFAELAVLTVTGELPMFGVLQKYLYSKHPYSESANLDESIFLFRQNRDLAFSIAGASSASIFLFVKWWEKRS